MELYFERCNSKNDYNKKIKIEEVNEGRENKKSAKGNDLDTIVLEQNTSKTSSLTKQLSDMITALYNKKSVGISDDVQKFQRDTHSNINDVYADLNTRINENIKYLCFNITDELHNDTKHIASHQEAINDETKTFIRDLRDGIKIMQSKHHKPSVTFSLNFCSKINFTKWEN